MKRALVVLAVVCASSLAAHAHNLPNPRHILGWTDDGMFFAYTDNGVSVEAAEGTDEMISPSATRAFVLDGRTGKEVAQFSLAIDAEASAAAKKAEAALPKKAEWAAWQKAHATKCRGGRASADGAAKAEIVMKGKGMVADWDKGDYAFHVGDEDAAGAGGSATFTMNVVRGGKTFPSATWSGDGGSGELHGDIAPCWSPDGRRVMWLVQQGPESSMRDGPHTTLLLGPAAGPRIELRADAAILDAVLAPVATALDAAGFAVTASKLADEARPKTVIYYTPDFAEVAARMAPAVPGGASVEAMTWKSPKIDVIVAIGASARTP